MKNAPVLVACSVLGLLWLAAVCARDWTASENYRYGWFVPLLAAYFLFKRLPWADGGFPVRGLRAAAWATLALAALAVTPLETIRLAPLPWRLVTWAIYFVVVAAILATATLRFGAKEGFKLAAFPCLFLATGVPWPTFLEVHVSLPAMYAVAGIVTELLRLLGIPAICTGTQIIMSNQVIGIEEACSGLRSLQAALMTALACGEIFRLRFSARLFVLVFALPVAFVTNVLRSLALALAGNAGGSGAIDQWHDLVGWITLLIVIASIGLFAAAFRSRVEITEVVPPKRSIPTSGRAQYALLLVGVAGFLVANGWYAFHDSRSDAPSALFALRGEDPRLLIEEPPASVLSILNPTDGKYASASLATYGSVVAYHLYWAAARDNAIQLYHRPDLCMPGAGWKPAGAPRPLLWPPGNPIGRWQIIPYERGAQRASLIWGAWLDGKPFEIDLTSTESLQWRIMLQLVRNGRRSLAYEVGAVLVPADKGWPSESQAADALSIFFATHANSARR